MSAVTVVHLFSAVVHVRSVKFNLQNRAVRLRLSDEPRSTSANITSTSMAQIVAFWVISVLARLKYGSQR